MLHRPAVSLKAFLTLDSYQWPGHGTLVFIDCTALSAAHVMRWNDDHLYNIEKDFGEETAKLVAESHKTAIDTMEQVCQAGQTCLLHTAH